jgi:ABC-type antimicrobial peptide transport system permease subunit
MNEPRVYKNSPLLFILMLFVFGILFVGLVVAMGSETWYILAPFGLAFGLIFLVAIFSMTSKTMISDEEISTQNLLGTRTLRWSEVNHVSGRGYAIKLQDVDRGVTVAPNPQLPGYPEVIEWIGIKRPDLFDAHDHGEFSKSWLGTIFPAMFGLLFMGAGLFVYTRDGDTFLPFVVFAVIGLVFIAMTLVPPQKISIQGNSLLINYLFQQKTLKANEIASIGIRYTHTRQGKRYFAAINLVNGKTIHISALRPSLPMVYLVLKNWHLKNTQGNELPGRS